MKIAMQLIVMMFLAISSCAYQNPYASHAERDMQTGALLGGAVGSMIGQQTHDGLAGAAIGAGIGGLLGSSIGYEKDRRQDQNQQPYGGGNFSYGYGSAGFNTNSGCFAGGSYGHAGY